MKPRELSELAVLEYYDGPILFTAEDAAESKYICVFLQESEAGREFLCARVAPSALRRFLAGGTDLRTLILDAPLVDYFSLNMPGPGGKGLLAVPITLESVPVNLLPAADYFVPLEIGSPLLSNERVVMDAALEVYEAKDEPVIDAWKLGAFLKVIQDLLRFAYKKAISPLAPEERKHLGRANYHTAQVFGIGQHASFGILLRSKDTADLAHYTEFERALHKTEQILRESRDVDRTIDVLRENKGHLVGAYRRLLDFLIESNATLRIKWSVPRPFEPIKRFSIVLDDARKIQAALAYQLDMNDELMDLVGPVIQVHIESGAWTLQTQDGEYHRGEVEKGARLSLAGITAGTKYYKFRCKEEVKINAMGKEHRSLLLYEYEELNPLGSPPVLSSPSTAPPLGEAATREINLGEIVIGEASSLPSAINLGEVFNYDCTMNPPRQLYLDSGLQ